MVGKDYISRNQEMLLVPISIVIIVTFRLVNPNFLSAGSLSGIMQAMSITGFWRSVSAPCSWRQH